MTGTETWAGARPEALVAHLFATGELDDRRLRLFACACGRRVWDELGDSERRAVVVAEKYADGDADGWALRRAREAATAVLEASRTAVNAAHQAVLVGPTSPGSDSPNLSDAVRRRDMITLALRAVSEPRGLLDAVRRATTEVRRVDRSLTDADLLSILRDSTGGAGRRLLIPAGWLEFHGGFVAGLARSIYDQHRFDEFPVLADALEEAGCHESVVLGHLREDGTHVRGCWALDLLVGKAVSPPGTQARPDRDAV